MLNDNIEKVREKLESEMEKGNWQSELILNLSTELDELIAQFYRNNGKTFAI
jgi:hypothetical protein